MTEQTAYRLVKRADQGAGAFLGVRIDAGDHDEWSRDPRDEREIILTEAQAEDAAQTWNDYAATKGYPWRVVVEPA